MTNDRIERPQLRMIWPSNRVLPPSALRIPSPYSIRRYQAGDKELFLALMAKTDFGPWDNQKLSYNMARIIPAGWFFAFSGNPEDVVGTAMCLHNYSGNDPFTGDVGWLVSDPKHRGHGLGQPLTAHAINRFLGAGYARIQLHTEAYRLPAIKTYLKLGLVPVLESREMHSLWAEVVRSVNWPFTPGIWPSHV